MTVSPILNAEEETASMAVKKIDHIGIVVKDIEAALRVYRDALGLELVKTESVPEQKVKVAFLPAGESEIELVQPTSEDSGVARYLARRGEGIHHICLEVDDIEATLARVVAQGMELIDETPRTGSGGQKLAFVRPRSACGVLIEFYEKP
jgi:methylmalonyl-CoA epimerase